HTLLSLLFTLRPPPTPTLFPYTTLFRSDADARHDEYDGECAQPPGLRCHLCVRRPGRRQDSDQAREKPLGRGSRRPLRRSRLWQDRKSTRLNSSHDQISYAVFCLKKKKQ